MHFSRVDLNLFTVFQAIYEEGGITPASRRLHLSQPAVSHALARLRELLNDPLFERRGNDMVPTAMARLLAPTIARALGGLDVMLQSAGHFDPLASQHHFTIAVRAAQEMSFLPELVTRLAEEAPRIDVATVRIDRGDLVQQLARGEIDCAIDVGLPLPADIRRDLLFVTDLVVVARADHPAVRGHLDLDTYLAQQHILVTGRRHGGGHEDLALGNIGKTRRIRARCQQHGVACEIVAQSDLLATMTRGHAAVANRHLANQTIAFPLAAPPFETYLYWHGKSDSDPAARWFRGVLRGALVDG